MIKEIFKKQIVITDIGDETALDFEIRLATNKENLKENALASLFENTEEYQFTGEEKLFFMPGCTVPRFKIKQMSENEGKGMCTVKSSSRADVIIYGSETSKAIINSTYDYYTISLSSFTDYVNNNYEVADSRAIKIKKFLDNTDPEEIYPVVVICNYGDRNYMANNKRSYSLSNNDLSSHGCWVTDEKKMNDLEDMLALGKPLVNQDVLIPFLNSDVVMDEAMYTEVCKMFESKDANNHVLAMELMANCDSKKSLMFLIFLMAEYDHQINARNERKHVNFKALTSAIDCEPGDIYDDAERIVEELIKRDAIGSDELNFIMKKFEKAVEDTYDNRFIVSAGIKPSQTLLDAIAKVDAMRKSQTVEAHVGSDE